MLGAAACGRDHCTITRTFPLRMCSYRLCCHQAWHISWRYFPLRSAPLNLVLHIVSIFTRRLTGQWSEHSLIWTNDSSIQHLAIPDNPLRYIQENPVKPLPPSLRSTHNLQPLHPTIICRSESPPLIRRSPLINPNYNPPIVFPSQLFRLNIFVGEFEFGHTFAGKTQTPWPQHVLIAHTCPSAQAESSEQLGWLQGVEP